MIALVNYPYNQNNLYNRNQLGSIGLSPWMILGIILAGAVYLGTKKTGRFGI